MAVEGLAVYLQLPHLRGPKLAAAADGSELLDQMLRAEDESQGGEVGVPRHPSGRLPTALRARPPANTQQHAVGLVSGTWLRRAARCKGPTERSESSAAGVGSRPTESSSSLVLNMITT